MKKKFLQILVERWMEGELFRACSMTDDVCTRAFSMYDINRTTEIEICL